MQVFNSMQASLDLKQRCEASTDSLMNVNRENKEKRKELNNLERKISTLEETCNQLELSLKQTERDIIDLNDTIQMHRNELKMKNIEIDEWNQNIVEFNRLKEAEISSLLESFQSKQKQCMYNASNSSLDSKTDPIASLPDKDIAIQGYLNEIEDLKLIVKLNDDEKIKSYELMNQANEKVLLLEENQKILILQIETLSNQLSSSVSIQAFILSNF